MGDSRDADHYILQRSTERSRQLGRREGDLVRGIACTVEWMTGPGIAAAIVIIS